MSKPINLLWTGGWDSTFRLLEALIIEELPLQPIYVIDTTRKSLVNELKTMEKIIALLKSDFGESASRLSPTAFYFKETSGFEYIHRYFNEFRKRYHIGDQYLWLAIISEKYGLDELEIGQENVDKETATGTWMSEVLPLLSGVGHNRKLNYDTSKSEKLLLFKNFRYPIFQYSKLDMAETAKEHGFYNILKHAWFCHYPVYDKPCGLCRPCTIAKRSGQLTVHKMNRQFVSRTHNFVRRLETKLIKRGFSKSGKISDGINRVRKMVINRHT